MLKEYQSPAIDPATLEELNAFVDQRRAELRERKTRAEWRK
jgi:trimethylamine:corrinoid methyltransferase-like protein